MKELVKLTRKVLQYGGSIDWVNSEVTRSEKILFIDAPEDKNWNASECGIICLNWLSGTNAEFYSEALDLVSEGIQ